MVPEERNAVGAISPLESPSQRIGGIHIRGHNLSPRRRERASLFRLHIPRQRPDPKPAFRVLENGLDQPTPLRPGSPHHSNSLFHLVSPISVHPCASVANKLGVFM